MDSFDHSQKIWNVGRFGSLTSRLTQYGKDDPLLVHGGGGGPQKVPDWWFQSAKRPFWMYPLPQGGARKS